MKLPPSSLKQPIFMSIQPTQWRASFCWAYGLMVASTLFGLLSLFFVFVVWFPQPWRQMLGVNSIVWFVIAANVMCGPFLTKVLASQRQSSRAFLILALVQLAALGYCMWLMFAARPVIVAFEIDRFVVVTANEVLADQLGEAPTVFQSLSWMGVRFVATRTADTADEQLKSIELSMTGVTSAMRPGWWRPYEEADSDIAKAAKPLSELMLKRPEQFEVLNHAVEATGLELANLRYVPLTSSRQLDWVTLLNVSSQIVGHAPVDGFD